MQNPPVTDQRYVDVFAFSPAGRVDVRVGGALAVLFALATAATLPWASLRTPMLEPVLPTVGAIVLLTYTLTAVLFVGQYLASRQAPLAYVSIATAFNAVFTVLWWTAMPHVYTRAGLFTTSLDTPVVLLVSGTAGYLAGLIAMIACDLPAVAPVFADRRTQAGFLALTLVLASLAIVVAYRFPGSVPPLVDGIFFTPYTTQVVAPAIAVLVMFALGLLLFAKRLRQAIDVWFAIALFTMGLELIINEAGGTRDSLGFYIGRILSAGEGAAVLILMQVKMYGLVLTLLRTNRTLDSQASTDELTGLPNRRSFNRAVGTLFAEQRRELGAAALLMIDLDEFKLYNDGFGHAAGDDALVSVGRALQQTVSRAEDTVARVGGEEFAVILRDTDQTGALTVAERIRERVESMAIGHAPGASHATMTVSIGVASTAGPEPIASYEALAASADAALYAAKAAGRNRVAAAP